MILDCGENNSFPPDIRVEKEAKSLVENGFEVNILTRHKSNLPFDEVHYSTGAKISRVQIKDPGPIKKLLNAFTLINRSWADEIKVFSLDNRIDVLHVHDLNLVPITVIVARELRIPVVADLHENLPAAMLAYRSCYPIFKKFLYSLIWNYKRMKSIESKYLKECLYTIIVTPEASDRLINYGIDKKSLVLVSNTEDETTFDYKINSRDSELKSRFLNSWIVSYIGGGGAHRGLDTLINSIKKASSVIVNLRLIIVGVSDNDKPKLLNRIKELKISEFVEIIEWQPFEMVKKYIHISNVCTVPHNDFEHTQTTVPHKLFQYMICEKPVLVSDCKPLKRIVCETSAGIIFKANNHNDLSDKLIWMYRNNTMCKTFGENGSKAAKGKFSWKSDSKRLNSMYCSIRNKYNLN